MASSLVTDTNIFKYDNKTAWQDPTKFIFKSGSLSNNDGDGYESVT